MLKENTKILDFILLDQDENIRKLSGYPGKVFLYFYPKDDTPGCTKEACGIAALYNDFAKQKITVLGISSDSPESHRKFRKKYDLTFTLLSDPEKEVIKMYDALGPLGTTKRVSYFIEDGLIKKAYPKVDPEEHAKEVLRDVAK